MGVQDYSAQNKMNNILQSEKPRHENSFRPQPRHTESNTMGGIKVGKSVENNNNFQVKNTAQKNTNEKRVSMETSDKCFEKNQKLLECMKQCGKQRLSFGGNDLKNISITDSVKNLLQNEVDIHSKQNSNAVHRPPSPKQILKFDFSKSKIQSLTDEPTNDSNFTLDDCLQFIQRQLNEKINSKEMESISFSGQKLSHR